MSEYNTASVKTKGQRGKTNAIKNLSTSEYAATSKAKRLGKSKGKQHVAQPKKVAKKTAKFR